MRVARGGETLIFGGKGKGHKGLRCLNLDVETQYWR